MKAKRGPSVRLKMKVRGMDLKLGVGRRELGDAEVSVMVSGLRQEDAMIRYFIHEAVFLRDPAGPDSASQVSERLGLSYTREGIPPYSLYEIKNLSSGLMISGNPVAQIFQEVPIDNDLQFLPAHPFSSQHVIAVRRGSYLPLPRLHSD
jgi:hypothetical protein